MDPSCTLSNTIGLSSRVICNRQNQLVNISSPFTSFYNASLGKMLGLTIADILLPTGVQPIGLI
jgi:hypothetical protein